MRDCDRHVNKAEVGYTNPVGVWEQKQ